MSRKLKIDDIRYEFGKENCILLTNKYENESKKLYYICPEGHKHSISWSSWRRGVRCAICARHNRRLRIGFIRDQFEKEGYKLLTKTYNNSRQKLDYICPKGHKHSIRWHNWQQGKRCLYCSMEKSSQKRKKNIEDIRQAFESEGYTLLTIDYKNSKQKLRFICPVGHAHQIAWEKWQGGVRCFYCFGTPRKTLEEVKESFEKEGYILLTKYYKNAQQKLNYVCNVGHEHSIIWNGWQSGQRCPYCDGNARKTIEEVRESFTKEGYTLLSKNYTNSDARLKYICPKGHKHSIKWGHWNYGVRCPDCGNQEIGEKAKQRWINPEYQKKMAKAFAIKPNKPEQAFNKLLQSLFPNEYKYVGDFQFFLGGKNPDFMNINGKKFLIELFGDYWHKNDDPQDRINHFKQYGFDTLVIWERELKDQRTLKDKLKKFNRGW